MVSIKEQIEDIGLLIIEIQERIKLIEQNLVCFGYCSLKFSNEFKLEEKTKRIEAIKTLREFKNLHKNQSKIIPS